MKYFLTSHISRNDEKCLNEENGFVERLKEAIGDMKINCLCISSKPSDIKGSEYFANLEKRKFENSGIYFTSFHSIHKDTAKAFDKLLEEANMLLLSGGHVPSQNKFFQKLKLKEKLKYFDGIVVGISAGSMNAQELVYAMPELDGEARDSKYERFIPGLGLTFNMIIPHYYEGMENETLDGLNLFTDIMIPDSKKREFLLFPDGTYIYGDGVNEMIFGSYKLVKNGKIIDR